MQDTKEESWYNLEEEASFRETFLPKVQTVVSGNNVSFFFIIIIIIIIFLTTDLTSGIQTRLYHPPLWSTHWKHKS